MEYSYVREIVNATMVIGWFLLLVSFVLVFKPLLAGVVKAAWLVVHPRLSKDQRKAKGALRDAQLVQTMINRNYGPSDAAELRALACRQ
jgi:hypothetical protein